MYFKKSSLEVYVVVKHFFLLVPDLLQSQPDGMLRSHVILAIILRLVVLCANEAGDRSGADVLSNVVLDHVALVGGVAADRAGEQALGDELVVDALLHRVSRVAAGAAAAPPDSASWKTGERTRASLRVRQPGRVGKRNDRFFGRFLKLIARNIYCAMRV